MVAVGGRRFAAAVMVVGLVGALGLWGVAGAGGSVRVARFARGGAPEVWPLAPARGVLVRPGVLARLVGLARGSGRLVEVRGLRSARSRTFVAPGGGFVRRFSAGAGVGAGVLSWGGSGWLARLSWGRGSLRLGWGALSGAAPTFDGLTAGYRGVGGGVVLRVQGDGEGFQLRIVIARRPTGPVRFTFPLALRGLRARVGANGLLEFRDRAGGVVVTGSLRGRVAGAQSDTLTGRALRTGRVLSRLVTTAGGGQALEVVPDPAFLRDAHVEYPVTIEAGAIGLAAPARLSR